MPSTLDLSPYRTIPEGCQLVLEVQEVAPDAMAVGLQEAHKVFHLAHLHPFTGYRAQQELDLHWSDVVNAPAEIADQLMYEFHPLCVWADIWADAEKAAMLAITTRYAELEFKFRFTLTWPEQAAESTPPFWNTFRVGPKAFPESRYTHSYEKWLD